MREEKMDDLYEQLGVEPVSNYERIEMRLMLRTLIKGDVVTGIPPGKDDAVIYAVNDRLTAWRAARLLKRKGGRLLDEKDVGAFLPELLKHTERVCLFY